MMSCVDPCMSLGQLAGPTLCETSCNDVLLC